jgi:glycogen(starch) synthase
VRILFLTENFWPYIGGVEVFSAKLLPALCQYGHEFIVGTTHYYLDLPDEQQYQGIPIHRFPLLSALANSNIEQLLKTVQQITKLKRNFRPHLVHVHSVGLNALLQLQTAEAYPTPVLVTLQQPLLNDNTKPDTLQGRIVRSADWVTCCSEALLVDTRRRIPEITPRSSVIHNARDLPLLSPEPLPTGEPRLLCLGRLTIQKGFDLAVRALRVITDRFPHARLIIAGDGPERNNLAQLVVELGLEKVVDFVGWVAPDHVPALMNTATVVVMPSRWEGLPLVALEAALMARPLVTTPVEGLPEVVVHQQTGLLVEKENSEALAEALIFLLDQPEIAIAMGQAARRRVQEVFSFANCVDAYDATYRRLATAR